jgi:hypothetical protein
MSGPEIFIRDKYGNITRARTGKWVVDLKAHADGTISELSVIREDFAHGFKSYGWEGADKVIIAGSGGPCSYEYSKELSALLLTVAYTHCDQLNLNEVSA